MKMFIPALRTKLRLTEDWSISLICEQRNKTLWDMKSERTKMDSIPSLHRRGQAASIELTKGDELTIRRIFIRQGYEGYNSVTMSGKVDHMGVKRPCRFWVLLDCFNNMEAEVIE